MPRLFLCIPPPNYESNLPHIRSTSVMYKQENLKNVLPLGFFTLKVLLRLFHLCLDNKIPYISDACKKLKSK